MPKNPSELARLEGELEYAWEQFRTVCNGKSSKEAKLQEIRKLESQLGIEHKPYNGS